jgi:hypothetical protein
MIFNELRLQTVTSSEAAAVSGALRRLREENVALSLALGSAQTSLNRANDEMIEKRSISLKRMEEAKADASFQISSVEKELTGARSECRRLSRRAKQLEDELRASISDLNSAQSEVRSLRSELDATKRDAMLASTSVSPRKIAVALVERWKETSLVDSFTSSPTKINSGSSSESISNSQSRVSTTRSHISYSKAFTGLTAPVSLQTETIAIKPPQVSRLLSKWTKSGALATNLDVTPPPPPPPPPHSPSIITTTSLAKEIALNISPRSSPLSLHRSPPSLPAPLRFSSTTTELRSSVMESSMSSTSALSLQTQVELLNAEVEKTDQKMAPLLVQLSTVLNDLHKAEAKIANDHSLRLDEQAKAKESAELISRLEQSNSDLLLRVISAEERANEAETTIKEFQSSASSDFLRNELSRLKHEHLEEMSYLNAELKKRSESFQEMLSINANLQRELQEEHDISNELQTALETSAFKQSALKTQLTNALAKLDDAYAKLAHTETSRADDAQNSSNELELASAVRQTMHELMENEARVHAREIADAFDKQKLTEGKVFEAQCRAERAEKMISETQLMYNRVFATVDELQRRLSLALEEISRRNLNDTMHSQSTAVAESENERLRLSLQETKHSSASEIRKMQIEIVHLREQSRLVQSFEKDMNEALKLAESARADADIERSARLTLTTASEEEVTSLKNKINALTEMNNKLVHEKDAELQSLSQSLMAAKDEEIRTLTSSMNASVMAKDEESRRLYEALADSAERINVLRKKLLKAEERIQELHALSPNQKVVKSESVSSSSGSKGSPNVSSSDWFSSDLSSRK